ncbi:MAG: hypothetical protein M4D80_14315 [Myxococcota bacterium]|nr:hypothetical protein [Deltaproteobacteria bacterium]MDQ3336339.1 hypothetical protein [Myxococcota bacterium]
MTLHLARISVITIALALVAGLGFLLARPQAPMVITVVVPAPTAQTTVVQPTYVHPYWYGPCGARVCWR